MTNNIKAISLILLHKDKEIILITIGFLAAIFAGIFLLGIFKKDILIIMSSVILTLVQFPLYLRLKDIENQERGIMRLK